MEHNKYIVALGLVSTCVPEMIIDIDDPIGMMRQVCDKFDAINAEVSRLKAELTRCQTAPRSDERARPKGEVPK